MLHVVWAEGTSLSKAEQNIAVVYCLALYPNGNLDHILVLYYWQLQFRKWGALFSKKKGLLLKWVSLLLHYNIPWHINITTLWNLIITTLWNIIITTLWNTVITTLWNAINITLWNAIITTPWNTFIIMLWNTVITTPWNTTVNSALHTRHDHY
jgi:hypothetical protein